MNSITQDIKFKQSVVKYSLKNGVTTAAIQYNLHRKTIYRWRERQLFLGSCLEAL